MHQAIMSNERLESQLKRPRAAHAACASVVSPQRAFEATLAGITWMSRLDVFHVDAAERIAEQGFSEEVQGRS